METRLEAFSRYGPMDALQGDQMTAGSIVTQLVRERRTGRCCSRLIKLMWVQLPSIEFLCDGPEMQVRDLSSASADVV